MALENIAEIEQSLGIEAGKLTEMITSEEKHTIDLTKKVIFDKDVYDERIKNIKTEASTAAIEVAVKEKRKELGLEFQGKTIDNLVSAIREKTEAESKIEPEEKYKTLKSDFERLQENFAKQGQEFETFKTNIDKQKEYEEIKTEFTKNINGETFVSKSTIFTEAKEKGFSFVKEDGKIIVKGSDGQTLKDEKTLSPISISDFAANFATPYIKTATGGGGGGDEGNKDAKAGSLEAFMKEAEKAGWNATQQNSEMQKRIADGTLKL